MNKSKDYITLMDIAKINLSGIINAKMKEYKNAHKAELKEEIIKLLNDRKELFMFNQNVIEKYL